MGAGGGMKDSGLPWYTLYTERVWEMPGAAPTRTQAGSPGLFPSCHREAFLGVWECCRAGCPQANPHAGPSTQQRGTLLPPTHLASVSGSCPAPHPLSGPPPPPPTRNWPGGHFCPCPPQGPQRAQAFLSPQHTSGLRALPPAPNPRQPPDRTNAGTPPPRPRKGGTRCRDAGEGTGPAAEGKAR